MAADTPDDAGRAVVVLTAVVLVGALYGFYSAYEPTDLAGLAVQWGAFLCAFVVAGVVLVRVYVPEFDDDVVESGDGSGPAEWDDDWGVSAEEVAVAAGLAVLLVAGGRFSLALGPMGVVVFLPLVIGIGAAASRWLYDPESGRAAADDHPFTSSKGVIRHQTRVLGNIVVWFVLVLVALFVDPTPDGVPPAALAVAALLGLAVTHWLQTRVLVSA